MFGFEGTGTGEAEIACLGGAEGRQFDAELVEVQGGYLLVEVLGLRPAAGFAGLAIG
jgi:hypothetical protein